MGNIPKNPRNPELFENLEPVVINLGYNLLDAVDSFGRESYRVQCIIHKNGGISIDDCSRVHKVIMPRLEILSRGRSVSLEVASPGLSRMIKSWYELKYFIGENVRILCGELWRSGTLVECNDDSVVINDCSNLESFEYSAIKKIKLDFQ